MTEKENTLEQAVRQVAESKRFIAEQRQRIEKLRASGISTLDAEQTLDVLSSTLKLLENHERYVRQHTLKKPTERGIKNSFMSSRNTSIR